MKKIILLIFLFSSFMGYSQEDSYTSIVDTVYLKVNQGFIVDCKRSKAEGYHFKTPLDTTLHLCQMYYLQSNNLMAEYEVYDKELANLKNDINTIISIKNGKYTEFYLSGEKRVSCVYVENKLQGDFKVFYPNGQMKRIEQWENGEWMAGECYDEDGNSVEYCSYSVKPEFVGGNSNLFKYISKNLTYPAGSIENDSQGKVYVKFIIGMDGSIKNPEILKGVDRLIDQEAIRLVTKMPNWTPGKFEGELVESSFVLPLNFKLQ